MKNIQRLQMEIQGIELSQNELSIYIEETGLQPHDEYNSSSQSAKRNIYLAALSILESIANNPSSMKNYKHDDMTVSDFADNLQNRIDQLERKVRTMRTDEQPDSNYFMLFNN